jgi:AraC-like DNA-binding protein
VKDLVEWFGIRFKGQLIGLCFGRKGTNSYHAVLLHPKGYLDISTNRGGDWTVDEAAYIAFSGKRDREAGEVAGSRLRHRSHRLRQIRGQTALPVLQSEDGQQRTFNNDLDHEQCCYFFGVRKVRAFDPDVAICTHFLPAEIISWLTGKGTLKTRQAIVGSCDVDDGVMIGHAEALLHSVLPARDPLAGQVAALVARITDDPGLRRVDQLSASSGITPRTLQRLFADYVGVSPKWVMRRARLHDAAERADSGDPVDWAALASDLGYADQAHLTRDFTVTIGVPPARYAVAP